MLDHPHQFLPFYHCHSYFLPINRVILPDPPALHVRPFVSVIDGLNFHLDNGHFMLHSHFIILVLTFCATQLSEQWKTASVLHSHFVILVLSPSVDSIKNDNFLSFIFLNLTNKILQHLSYLRKGKKIKRELRTKTPVVTVRRNSLEVS